MGIFSKNISAFFLIALSSLIAPNFSLQSKDLVYSVKQIDFYIEHHIGYAKSMEKITYYKDIERFVLQYNDTVSTKTPPKMLDIRDVKSFLATLRHNVNQINKPTKRKRDYSTVSNLRYIEFIFESGDVITFVAPNRSDQTMWTVISICKRQNISASYIYSFIKIIGLENYLNDL